MELEDMQTKSMTKERKKGLLHKENCQKTHQMELIGSSLYGVGGYANKEHEKRKEKRTPP